MYFYRCYNRDCQYRRNRPTACKTEQIIPKQEHFVSFKTASAGGITVTGIAGTEKEYDLIGLTVDSCKRKNAAITLSFACNITLIDAKLDLGLQLVKSGESQPVPVASPAVYRRISEFSGSDAISFTIHDPAPVQNGSCTYLVKMYVTFAMQENGLAIVTNPVLTALIF